MILTVARVASVLLATWFFTAVPANTVRSRSPALPNPILVLMGQELYEANGKQWTRYKYAVQNFADYPNELFAASPDLPPCGRNTNASRTWVDFYAQDGKRLYGFCALGNHDDLGKLWFALERDTLPPSWVYIEMNDRKTNTRYKSNLADTCL